LRPNFFGWTDLGVLAGSGSSDTPPRKMIGGAHAQKHSPSMCESQTRVSQAKFLLVLLVLKLIKAVNCKDFVYTTQIREK
jgi:hypothetical protein